MRFKYRLLLITTGLIILVTSASAGGFGTPSNTCGIWKKEFTPGLHLVSFPLLPELALIDSVLGNQLPPSTNEEDACKISTLFNGDYISSYNSATQGHWVGLIDTLIQTKSYWLEIPEEFDTIEITLVGAAMDIDSTVICEMMSSGSYMIATPSVFTVSLANSGLSHSGIGSNVIQPRADRILNWGNDIFNHAWYNGETWSGFTFNLEPWQGYVLEVSPVNEGFTWIYNTPEDVLDIPIIRNDNKHYRRYLNLKIAGNINKTSGGLE